MARLVVLAHRIPYPPNKGEKLRTFHQLEILKKFGHDICVIAPLESSQEEIFSKQLSETLNVDVKTVVLGQKLLRLLKALYKNQSFSEANFFSSELLNVFGREIKNADAILLTASSLIPYVKHTEVPDSTLKLMDFMDVDSDKWEQYANQSKLIKRMVYAREAKKVANLESYTLSQFDESYIISNAEKMLLENKFDFDFNCKILGNGIDQSLFNPCEQKPESQVNYLFSGVMDYKPNIDAVLWFVKHCWTQISLEVPQAKFIIAGMNPTKNIQALEQTYSNIEVTGFVDDIKPYFDSAHVFVAPFRIARGVQNKILQAMACALPVVSTALGAEGILCEHERNIIITDDAESFADNCIELAQNKSKAQQLGRGALQRINDHYAWESVLQPLIRQLNKL